jgi:peptidoglycan/xylan/chitin deacetylase (PgdA/CDA1 family)
MKHFFRNSFIFFCTIIGFSYIYRMALGRKGPLVRILTFHDIRDIEWFTRTIAFMKTKYNIISPDDFSARHFDTTRINVLITFDDGYASWLTALPVLALNSVQAMFFINSGLMNAYGQKDAQERFVRERLMLSPRDTISWDGVRELSDAGHTIGGHTITHARLSELQELEARDEIAGDKAYIQTEIHKAMTFFAYPFGTDRDFNEGTKRLVQESGYAYGFTTEGVFAKGDDPYAVSRLGIEDNASLQTLCAWIEGGYDLFQKLKKVCVR